MKKKKLLDFIKKEKMLLSIGTDKEPLFADAILVDDLMKFINEQQEYLGVI